MTIRPTVRQAGALRKTNRSDTDIVQDYLRRLDRKQVKACSFAASALALRKLQEWLADRGTTPSEASAELVEEYFDYLVRKGFAISYVRVNLVHVRAAYGYAWRRGVLLHDPTLDVILPREPDREPRTYSRSELRAVVGACQTDRESLVVALLMFTGMRKMEIADLRWADVDLAREQLTVVSGKGDKLRRIPIHPHLGGSLHQARASSPAGEWVIASPGDAPLRRHGMHRCLNGVLVRAGVRGSFHPFRRTVATELDEAGVRESVIDSIMGWAPRTVRARHYTRVVDGRLHDAIRTLYRGDEMLTQGQDI